MPRLICMNCHGNQLTEFIDLGRQPNGNNFLFPEEKAKNIEPEFSLKMLVCEDCWEVQIDDFPSPEFMFSNHPYITGVNVPVVRHFEKLAAHIVDKLALKANDLVIDVGCNDGTFLKCFENNGMRTLGVDPGKRTGELAKNQGKIVFRTFFNEAAGKAMHELGLTPDVITATAVFYHIPDLHDFVQGLKWVMDENTVFVVQGVYLKELIEKNEFDHFYHEHSCIHAIAPLKRLFEAHDMRLLDVESSEIHGGSFVLYVGLNSCSKPTSSSINEAIEAERDAGLFRLSTYKAFTERVHHNAIALKDLLTSLKKDGKRVFALGAPVKGSTFVNFAGIDHDLIECATEVNQFKIGRLLPGTSIPVVDESKLTEQPDYYLVLSWNFIDFLKVKYADYLRSGWKFIVAVP